MDYRNKKRNVNIDLLRIMASFAVVLIHVVYQSYLNFAEPANKSYLYLFNILCFAVPVFVMITGYLQLDPEKEYRLAKNIKRVLMPLICYGWGFAILERVFNREIINGALFLRAFGDVLVGKSWAHLWYLYMLIGLYLLLPFVKKAVSVMSIKEGICLSGIVVIFNSLIPMVEKLLDLDIAFKIPVNGVFVAYLLLGYYLPKLKKSKEWLLLSSVGSLLLVVYLSYKGIRLDSLNYDDIATIWISINIYLGFHYLEGWIEFWWNPILGQISKLTFGIYIIHMVFLNFAYKVFGINPYNHTTLVVWFLISIAVYVLSGAYVVIINKIPYLRKIVGL